MTQTKRKSNANQTQTKRKPFRNQAFPLEFTADANNHANHSARENRVLGIPCVFLAYLLHCVVVAR
jgi:hypothetical protein